MNIMYISEPDVGQFYLPYNTCTNAGKKSKNSSQEMDKFDEKRSIYRFATQIQRHDLSPSVNSRIDANP